MPRRSSSPGPFKRHGDRDAVDRYRNRRDAPDSYNRGADHEIRDSYRGTVSERDRRRDYRDNNYDDHYRRRDGDERRRRRDEYDADDGGRRRDDRRRADDDDDRRSRRGGEDRPARDRRDRDGERGGSARRSASPRRSRSHSASASAPPAEDKTKPNFAPSGLLAAATNTVKNADGTSTLLKYNEPPEARKPLVGWRLYVFKGEEQLGAFCILLLFLVAAQFIRRFF
jgi:smad nuclear-interacting protein 1